MSGRGLPSKASAVEELRRGKRGRKKLCPVRNSWRPLSLAPSLFPKLSDCLRRHLFLILRRILLLFFFISFVIYWNSWRSSCWKIWIARSWRFRAAFVELLCHSVSLLFAFGWGVVFAEVEGRKVWVRIGFGLSFASFDASWLVSCFSISIWVDLRGI